MNKLFIDADVILDLLLDRQPFSISAIKIFTLVEEKGVTACTSPLVLTNIYYISAKLAGKKSARQYIHKLLTLLHVTAIDEKIVLQAAGSSFKNFEDALLYYSAKYEAIDYLITRNKMNYKVTDLTVCTPEEYTSIYYRPSN